MLRPTLALLALAPAARAESTIDRDGREDGPREFELGAGVLGYVGGSFFDDEPDTPATVYPGFAGMGGGAGLALDFRWRGYLGLEVDFIRTSDHGKGEINIGRVTEFDVEIGQSAWHMPILLKVAIPAGRVNPYFVGGIDVVFPGEAKADTSPDLGAGSTAFAAHADRYTMWAFGLGFEIVLPVRDADVRIPFTLRGGKNPGTGDEASERADYEVSGNTIRRIDFSSEWQWHAGGSVGVVWYFL